MNFEIASSALLVLALGACGDDDALPARDAGRVDSGSRSDAGEELDAGEDVDAGEDLDAGEELDAGEDLDAGSDAGTDAGSTTVCPPGLGEDCDDMTPCAPGYECNIGRCTPQERPICGGFAGATCDDPMYPSCLFFTRADFGPCLTPAEVDCLCASPGAEEFFVCR